LQAQTEIGGKSGIALLGIILEDKLEGQSGPDEGRDEGQLPSLLGWSSSA
jgi:hypothetical protein